MTQTSSPLFPFVSTSSSTPSISVPLSTHQMSSQPVGVAGLQLTPLPPPPPKSGSLPVNWKEAKDQTGKVSMILMTHPLVNVFITGILLSCDNS